MRVDFYHLQKWSLEKALPLILEKVYASSERAIIKVPSTERAEYINNLLWTYDNNSWIPHASQKDGNPTEQPIWITTIQENPNNASILILLDSETIDFDNNPFKRILIIFNAKSNDELISARNAWAKAKKANAEIFYWQQNEKGSFEAKDLK